MGRKAKGGEERRVREGKGRGNGCIMAVRGWVPLLSGYSYSC